MDPRVRTALVRLLGGEDGRGLLDKAGQDTDLSNAGQSVDLLRDAVKIAGEAPTTTGAVTAIEVSGGSDLACQTTIALTRPQLLATAVPIPAPNGLHVIARVRWGAGGHFDEAEVDAIQGVQLSVNAAQVRVSLEARTVPNTQAYAVRAGAFISYYTRPSSRVPPTRTFYLTIVPAQGGAAVVPAFGTSVSVATTVPAQPFDVEILDGGAVPAILTVIPVPAGARLEGWPLPGAARFVRIQNPGPAIATFAVTFGLSL